MPRVQITRREFLIVGGAFAAATLVRSGAAAQPSPKSVAGTRVIFRLSLRGRRGSKAAKLHNANFRFATESAADANRAHPGDNSRIVGIIVSADEFDRLFTGPNTGVADLRSLGGPALVGDCDRNGHVVVSELVRGVNIALGNAPVSECKPFDRTADGKVTVNELIRGVGNALR